MMNSVRFNPATSSTVKPAKQPQVKFGESISITKTGKVERMPDSIRVNFALSHPQPAAMEDVVKDLNERGEALVKSLEELGLPKVKITSNPPSFREVYENYDHNNPNKVRQRMGFVGSIAISAIGKGIKPALLPEYASRIMSVGMDKGVDANGTNAGFFIADPGKAEGSAVKKAIRLATSLARQAAEAIGHQLGKAKKVDIGNNGYNYGGGDFQPMAAMAESAGGGGRRAQVSQNLFQLVPQPIESPPVTVLFETSPRPESPKQG